MIGKTLSKTVDWETSRMVWGTIWVECSRAYGNGKRCGRWNFKNVKSEMGVPIEEKVAKSLVKYLEVEPHDIAMPDIQKTLQYMAK